jgi:hypothetical protein
VKSLFNIFIASLLSIASAIGITTALLLLLSGLVNFFKWNENRDAYWVFYICIVVFVVVLRLSFSYFIGVLK